MGLKVNVKEKREKVEVRKRKKKKEGERRWGMWWRDSDNENSP